MAGEPSPELAASDGARDPTFELEGLRDPRRGAGDGTRRLLVAPVAELGVVTPLVMVPFGL